MFSVTATFKWRGGFLALRKGSPCPKELRCTIKEEERERTTRSSTNKAVSSGQINNGINRAIRVSLFAKLVKTIQFRAIHTEDAIGFAQHV